MRSSESAGAEDRAGRHSLASAGPAAIWIAAGAALASLSWAYDGPFLPLEHLGRWAWTASGLILVVASIGAARDPARRRAARSTAALVLLVLACSPVLWPWAQQAGWRAYVRAQLFMNRDRYDAVVALASRGGDEAARGWPKFEGLRRLVDVGPPVRVAFPIGEGVLDNWTAIVHDPTGTLGRLRPDSDPDDPLRMLFGGLIVRVRELGGGYYECVFT